MAHSSFNQAFELVTAESRPSCLHVTTVHQCVVICLLHGSSCLSKHVGQLVVGVCLFKAVRRSGAATDRRASPQKEIQSGMCPVAVADSGCLRGRGRKKEKGHPGGHFITSLSPLDELLKGTLSPFLRYSKTHWQMQQLHQTAVLPIQAVVRAR